MTPTLISAIRRQPHLPRNTWPLIAATTLSALNRPDEIPGIYTHALAHGQGSADAKPDDAEQLAISRRMREALVKSAGISGVPKVRERDIPNYPVAHQQWAQRRVQELSPVLENYLTPPGTRQLTPCWP